MTPIPHSLKKPRVPPSHQGGASQMSAFPIVNRHAICSTKINPTFARRTFFFTPRTWLPQPEAYVSLLERIWIACVGGMASSLAQACWYVLCASTGMIVAYVWIRKRLGRGPIAKKPLSRRQINWEILCSIRTLVIFGIAGSFMTFAAFSGWTRVYWQIADYGWGWFFLSVPVMILLHDTYFYWMHRLMHKRHFFRRFHRVHHLSVSPSPWSTYSCNVGEALLLFGIFPLILFTIPVHPRALLLFMAWQVAYSVLTHYGYELFPRWFLASRAGRLLISPTYHALHHESFHSNFGLYFSFWDRCMGTDHSGYAERFQRATIKLGRLDLPTAGGYLGTVEDE